LTDQKRRRRYTVEFKKEAVSLVTDQNYTIIEAAQNLGIPRGMLGRWRKEQLEKQQNAFPGTGHQSPEVEELNRLREENRRLKLEREILKKATAFFAKESG
jgi:transposase